MLVLWFMCSALLGLGTFYLVAHAMKYPFFASSLAVTSIRKNRITSIVSLKGLMLNISNRLSEHIQLNEYSKERLSAVLKSADIYITPESYLARAVISGAAILAITPIALLIFPPLMVVILLLAIAVFFKEYRSAFEVHEKKKKEIECELLRFASTVKESLKKSRDMLNILEAYRKTANTALSRELSITITDMRTGNYETALSRLSSRVNSNLLNDVVRGLLGTLRGDDQTRYFETIVDKMKELEIQKLRREVLKRPSKIKVYSFAMVVCFMLIYLVVMGVEILNSFGKLF